MSVGFVMLAHDSLGRAAEVACHLAGRGAPVVAHLDKRADAEGAAAFHDAIAEVPTIATIPSRRCEWGTWALVEATLEATERLLDENPALGWVYLISGACLPLRPLHELQAYLAAHPGTDFIESVSVEDIDWTVGGLDIERFTLHFPFAWKRQRRLFDLSVGFQRRFGVRRPIPDGVAPHIGSQWWCLSRATLEKILTDPARAVTERYFRGVWIPDESYFQTMVRRHGAQISSRSLTLSKFDLQGRPHVFYDDHLPLLRRSDCFFARKAWPRADGLYSSFLTADAAPGAAGDPNPAMIDRVFSSAVRRQTIGRPGLVMAGRYPTAAHGSDRTAAPYDVFDGFEHVVDGFPDWLRRATGARVHGHLFAPDRAEFAGGETMFSGALSDRASLRDYDPAAFLRNLLWNTRGERQAFLFGPDDAQDIAPTLAEDANARIFAISGAWTIPLFHRHRAGEDVRKAAAEQQRAQARYLGRLKQRWTQARVRIWTLADFLADPTEALGDIAHRGAPGRSLTEMPPLADLDGLPGFLHHLRDAGLAPYLAGDIDPARPLPTDPAAATRAPAAR